MVQVAASQLYRAVMQIDALVHFQHEGLVLKGIFGCFRVAVGFVAPAL